MLQKYSIMPHAIILFLFGLTLMTVSPVFAQQGSGGEFFLCGTDLALAEGGSAGVLEEFDGTAKAELSKDQYEECVKAVKAGENDSRLHVESGGDMESKKSEKQAGEPVQMKYREHGSELIHLNERILQLQKKELDKSLDTSTED